MVPKSQLCKAYRPIIGVSSSIIQSGTRIGVWCELLLHREYVTDYSVQLPRECPKGGVLIAVQYDVLLNKNWTLQITTLESFWLLDLCIFAYSLLW